MNTLIVLSLLIIRMVASFINDLLWLPVILKQTRSPFKEASVVLTDVFLQTLVYFFKLEGLLNHHCI
jgi:hypothetical protein